MEKIGVVILALVVIGQVSLPASLHTENFLGEKTINALDTKQTQHSMQDPLQRGPHTSDNVTTETKKRDAELNFTALTSYLLDLQFFDGGFQLHGGTQSYMNASYFASLALSLVGRFDEIERPLTLFMGNASTALNQTEGNTTLWGFKDWLMGEVGIRSTSYAILTTNISHSRPKGYNKSAIKYVNRTVKTYLTAPDPSLFNLSLATLALHSFQDPVHELDSEIRNTINTSLRLGNDPLFPTDETLSQRQNMLKSYLSLLILHRMHALPNETKVATSFLDAHMYKGDTRLQGGFGWNSSAPTVFQTGLALETLALLNSTINSALINDAIRFVNRSQMSKSGITQSPNGGGKDLFQTVGALLVYHATRKLFKKYNTTIKGPKEQIKKKLESVRFNMSARFAGHNLTHFLVNSSVVNVSTGQKFVPTVLSYNTSTGLYDAEIPTNSSVPNRPALDFGSYRLLTSLIPNITGLPLLQEKFERMFRVGFEINSTLIYPEKTASLGPSPGDQLQINFIAQGATEYLSTVGTFNYVVLRVNNSSIQKSASNSTAYNLTLSVNWSVPETAFLGSYRVDVYLNDSFGFNHSAARKPFRVWDSISPTVKGNQSSYTVGEDINFGLNLSYEDNGGFPHNVTTKLQFFWLKKLPVPPFFGRPFLFGESFRKISANNTINTSVPTDLPNSTRIQVTLHFIWGLDITNLDLFSFNLTLSGFKMTDLRVNGSTSQTFPIGPPLNANFTISENETNAPLVDSVVKAHVNWKNRTLQTLHPYSIKTSYVLNQSLDPNIPEENTTIDFQVLLPWNNTTVEVWFDSNITLEGLESGFHIETVKKNSGLEGEPVFLTLYIARESYPLTGLNLTANVSDKEKFSIPVGLLGDGWYLVSFTPEKSGKYNVKILRNIDELKLATYKIHVESKEEPFIKQWRKVVTIAVICGLVLGYLLVRWWVKKKISRRWLIQKWRRKREEQKTGKSG